MSTKPKRAEARLAPQRLRKVVVVCVVLVWNGPQLALFRHFSSSSLALEPNSLWPPFSLLPNSLSPIAAMGDKEQAKTSSLFLVPETRTGANELMAPAIIYQPNQGAPLARGTQIYPDLPAYLPLSLSYPNRFVSKLPGRRD